MKKTILRLFCVILSVVMLTFVAAPAFAAEERTAFVVVSGMNSYPLMNENGEKIYPFETDTVLKIVGELINPVSSYLIKRDAQKLGDEVLPVVRRYFEPIVCNEDGSSAHDVRVHEYTGELSGYVDDFAGEEKDELTVVRRGIEKFGAQNTYFFNYDWRLDPLDHADRLNTLIRSIKENSSCTRIAVAAFSMGGTVVCSYLYKYGSADIDSLSLCSTAFQGTSCMGSLFTADLELDMDGLMKRLAQLTRDDFLENLVEYINLKLSLAGFNERIEDFANSLTEELRDRIYAELLIPVFGRMPGFWALVDDVNFEKAKECMLGNNADYKLVERINEYHYNVQCKARELLADAQTDTDIYIIAQYNMQGLPVSKTSTQSNNDYLIDACYASGGAICAPLNNTLGEGYKQQLYTDIDYLSPDGQIDASICMFPDRTWFIRDMGHVDYPYGEAADFVLYLAENKNLTVFNGNYPQFMTYSYKTGSLTPVKSAEEQTASDKLFGTMAAVLKWFCELLAKLKAVFGM